MPHFINRYNWLLYAAALFWVNLYICSDLFLAEYIRVNIGQEQAITVSMNHHKGWSAFASGRKLPVRKDGLGFLLLQPASSGPIEIELTYNGGWEFLLCRLLSYATVVLLLVLLIGSRSQMDLLV